MSTGPRMIVSSRSLAAQISSTLMSPRAVSICASMPTWRLAAGDLLDLGEQQVERDHVGRASRTFGSISSSSRSDRVADDLDHVAVRPLRVPRVHAHAQDALAEVELLIASRPWPARPASRAARRRLRGRGTPCRRREPGAFPSIFSLEPGTDRHERRGRWRERSDMRKASVGRASVRNGPTVVGAVSGSQLVQRQERNVPPSQPTRCTSSPTACSCGSSPAANRV